MSALSERRLKENEIIFQQANKGVAEFIKQESGKKDTVIRFYCECSNMDCRKRIPLKASDYEKMHLSQRQFIALKGHEMPEIENIVSKHKTFNVVQKFGKMPSIKDIDVMLPSVAS